jgi:outer membrane protein OmpA-like peptidoglycan-associated protein
LAATLDRYGDTDLWEALRKLIDRGNLVGMRRIAVPSPAKTPEANVPPPEPDPPPPRRRPHRPPVDPPLHKYGVIVKADTGKPIADVKLKFEIGDTPRMRTTDSRGTATAEWFTAVTADVRVLEVAALRDKLVAEWVKPIATDLPSGEGVYRSSVGDEAAPLQVRADETSTLILCRTDKHVFELVAYDVHGQALEGIDFVLEVDGQERKITSDESGLVRYEGTSGPTAIARVADIKKARGSVAAAAASPPAEPNPDTIADAQTIVLGQDEPSVTLEADVPRKVVLRRRVVRVRLIGMFFDHSKTFLLPDALKGIRKVNEIYNELPDANLLVVGHTDTRHLDSPDADPDFNKKLSLDRAKSVAEYLTDNVDGWYAWYSSWGERLWGTTEDTYMLSNVPEADPPYSQDGDDYTKGVKKYQADRGLPTTGTPGERTRRALIKDYMSADGTTLPRGTTLTSHGCGPNFPDVPTGPNDDVPQNRRVEIFVFDGPIVPPPPASYSEPGSPEYPAWVAQLDGTVDFSTEETSDVFEFSF